MLDKNTIFLDCPLTSAQRSNLTPHLCACVPGVVSLVAVHPSTVNTLGKQLLPKTFGQSNVNITQQVVSGKTHGCWFLWDGLDAGSVAVATVS